MAVRWKVALVIPAAGALLLGEIKELAGGAGRRQHGNAAGCDVVDMRGDRVQVDGAAISGEGREGGGDHAADRVGHR